MLNDRQKSIIYERCIRCVQALGYEEDAPKFASKKGMNKHLKEAHNAEYNEREKFQL